MVLTGCGNSTIDDFATNNGYEKKTDSIDAFAIGVYAVNPNAVIYVRGTNS